MSLFTHSFALRRLAPLVVLVGLLNIPPLYADLLCPGHSCAVDTFGKKSADDTGILQAAVKMAISVGGPSEVVFGHGTYHFSCPPRQDSVLSISAAENLLIRGERDTRLIINSPTCGLIRVDNSANVGLKNFAVSYDPLPFSQTTITSVAPGENAITVHLDDGMPELSSPWFSNLVNMSGIVFKPQSSVDTSPRLKYSAHIGINHFFHPLAVKSLGNRDWKVTLSDHASVTDLVPGDRYVHSFRIPAPVLMFVKNKNIEVKQVSIYAGPGMGLVFGGNSGAINLDQVTVRPDPLSKNLQSTNADAIHIVSDRAQLSMTNCYLAGAADDALNIHTMGGTITAGGAVDMSHTTGVSDEAVPTFKGDQLQFVQIRYVKNTNGTYYVPAGGSPQVLDSQVVKTLTVTGFKSDGTTPIFNGSLPPPDAPLPLPAKGGALPQFLVFNVSASSPNAIVRNNVVDSIRGSVRLRSVQAIFDGNLIRDPGSARVLIGADAFFKEGPAVAANTIVLSNNCLTNFGTDCNSLEVDGSMYTTPVKIGSTAPASLFTHPLVYQAKIYRALYPDLAKATDTELQDHWLNHGIIEGRRASLQFSAAEYLQLNSDLAKGYGTKNYGGALAHFITNGAIVDQRPGSFLNHPLVYDIRAYAALNPDLHISSGDTLSVHWLTHGIYEGRQAINNFSSVHYLNRYLDLRQAYGPTNYVQAIYHYVLRGSQEGRSGE